MHLRNYTKACDQYPLIVETSSDGINTYELPSLGYRITDRHLPRGFVTSRKPALQFFVIIQIATVLTIYLMAGF
jgi:hypothetical protein